MKNTLLALGAFMMVAGCERPVTSQTTWQDVALGCVIGAVILGMAIADAIKDRKGTTNSVENEE